MSKVSMIRKRSSGVFTTTVRRVNKMSYWNAIAVCRVNSERQERFRVLRLSNWLGGHHG